MKIRRILFIVMAVLFCSTVCHAQTKDEVSLVVSGDGANKEEATKVALRSAIEQAYGTFVSANTSIVNDELTKDEIVTVSSGNIKSYEEIAYTQLPDGRSSVTLQAVVCISKLVSYAQSKGASTEFAGATFAMNMKMKELNKKNEELALQHLLAQMEAMIPYSYDAKLVIEEPAYADKSDFDVIYNLDDMIKYWFRELRKQTGKSYENEIAELTNFSENINNYYCVRMNVEFKANKTAISMFRMMRDVLRSLSLSQEESQEYYRQNIPHESIGTLTYLSGKHEDILFPGDRTTEGFRTQDFRTAEGIRTEDRDLSFRSPEGINSFIDKLQRLLYENYSGFCIVDNLGNTSSFDDEAFWDDCKIDEKRFCDGRERAIRGEGLFKPIVYVETDYDPRPNPMYKHNLFNISTGVSWKINVAIPKNEISKYTKFDLKRKKTVQGIDTYPAPEISLESDKIFEDVEVMPSFPDWNLFISKNLRYPAYAAKQGIQGRVMVQFVVEKDGSLTNIKVLKGANATLVEEAIRVVKSSPKWKPAMKDGKYVRCRLTKTINFRLQ